MINLKLSLPLNHKNLSDKDQEQDLIEKEESLVSKTFHEHFKTTLKEEKPIKIQEKFKNKNFPATEKK